VLRSSRGWRVYKARLGEMIEQVERQAMKRGVAQRDFDYLMGMRDAFERALRIPQDILNEQLEV